MDDLERYGDYNEYEDDIPKSKSKVILVLKILIGAVCVAVIGLFAFRMIMFNYYPDSMTDLYFNDTLTAYYNETDGGINAKTQKLRAPYDKEQGATFFADNLIVIEDIGQLQLSVRLLKSLHDDLEREWGVEISEDITESFSFALYRNNPDYDEEDDGSSLFIPIGSEPITVTDSSMTYDYVKLVFDGVDLDGVSWLSLGIYVNGAQMTEPYRIAVYENNEDYSAFTEYKLSGKEHP